MRLAAIVALIIMLLCVTIVIVQSEYDPTLDQLKGFIVGSISGVFITLISAYIVHSSLCKKQ